MDIEKEREAFEKYCFEVLLMSPSDGHFEREPEDHEFYESVDTHRLWKLWQAKAHAVPEGFVLIKDDTKTVVAIERMVEQQVEASGMDSRRLERLDGWKIIEAAVKAQEPAK